MPTCGFYLSRLDSANDPVRRALPWAAATLVIVVLVTAGLWLWSGARSRREAAQAATITFVGNRDLSGDTPSVFYLNVRNTGQKRIGELQLHVGAELLDACDLISLKPKYRSRVFDARQRMFCYDFGPLDVGKTLQVELTLKPPSEQFRRVAWKAEAYGDGGERLAQTTNVVHIVP